MISSTPAALVAGYEADEEAAGIAGHVQVAGPDAGHNSSHVRVFADNGHHRLLLPHHGIERDALGRFGEGKDCPCVLVGEEPLGNDPQQDRGQRPGAGRRRSW